MKHVAVARRSFEFGNYVDRGVRYSYCPSSVLEPWAQTSRFPPPPPPPRDRLDLDIGANSLANRSSIEMKRVSDRSVLAQDHPASAFSQLASSRPSSF